MCNKTNQQVSLHHLTSLMRMNHMNRKLEIKKTKPNFVISLLKVVYILGGLSFFEFQLFYYQNIPGKKSVRGLAAAIWL